MDTSKRPQVVITLENDVRVMRCYPTFARGWDAHVDASAKGYKVELRAPITEKAYQDWKSNAAE